MDRNNPDLTTGGLLSLIKNSDSFDQAVRYHTSGTEPLFKEVLYELMEQKQLTAKEMIRLSGIERSYFYHILSNGKLPARNMTLRLTLSLGCDLDKTNLLLRLAGHSSLYARNRRDALMIWGIEHGKDLSEVNELLISQGEAQLYNDK